MLSDDDADVRQQAIDIILDIRSSVGTLNMTSEIRKHQVPTLNFTADTYYLLIPKEAFLTEPPLTMKLSTRELLRFRQKQMSTQYSCTTVENERIVKLMTTAAGRLTDPAEQDGLIMNIKKARRTNPGPIVGKTYKFGEVPN